MVVSHGHMMEACLKVGRQISRRDVNDDKRKTRPKWHFEFCLSLFQAGASLTQPKPEGLEKF